MCLYNSCISSLVCNSGLFDSTITTIFRQIAENGFYHGFCFFSVKLFRNLRTVDLFSIFFAATDTYGKLSGYIFSPLV